MGTQDYNQYMNQQRKQILEERCAEVAKDLQLAPSSPTVVTKAEKKEQLFCEKLEAIRPAHYGGADNPYEVFAVLEAWNLDKDFYLGNVIKYIARAGKKDPAKEKEDLQKALVYLRRRIDSL